LADGLISVGDLSLAEVDGIFVCSSDVEVVCTDTRIITMDYDRIIDFGWHHAKKIAKIIALVPLRTFEFLGELDTAYSPIPPTYTPTKAEIAEGRAYILRHTDPASPQSRKYISHLAQFPELPCWLWVACWPQNRGLIDISKMARPTQTWLLTLTDKERDLLVDAGPSATIAHARGEEVVEGVRQPRQYRPQAKKLSARIIDNDVPDHGAAPKPSADLVSCNPRP